LLFSRIERRIKEACWGLFMLDPIGALLGKKEVLFVSFVLLFSKWVHVRSDLFM
jgi:hypothetical protein